MIAPMKRTVPAAIPHWRALTVRSGTGAARRMSPPPLGLGMSRLRRVREIGQEPLLDLLEPHLPPLPDLPDGDDGEELGEENVEEGEEGEAPRQFSPFHPGREVETLPERQPWVRQRRDDDDEALEPHPHAHRQGGDEDLPDGATAQPDEAEDRDDEVGENHPPEERPEGAGELGPEDV